MNEPRIAFELEVECRAGRNPLWYSWTDRLDANCQRDGSLRSGREYASRTPRTLQAWREFDLTDTLEQFSADVAADRTQTAGLHLHLDRSSFTGSGLARLFTIVNHSDQVVRRLSRRTRTRFCEFDTYETTSGWSNLAEDGLKDVYQRNYSHRKYRAVYCHERYPTVELRFFRSTVVPDRFYAALETAHALWAYAEQFPDRPATGMEWAAWVSRHPNYHTLRRELHARRATAATAAR
jgi:hypothetical protein